MILNSVFLSPIVSFYFILFCVFYFIHFSSFLFEILDIRIEFIEKQTKRYAIVLNDMLLESLFVWWRMAIPIPSQCAVEQHEEALRFCLTVLLFCADVFHFVWLPNVGAEERRAGAGQRILSYLGIDFLREFVIYIIYYHSLIYWRRYIAEMYD